MTTDSSTAASHQQPVSNSQLRDNQSATTTQQQSGDNGQLTTKSSATVNQQQAAQRQPVDNRELNSNQLTTTTSINNFVGPARMINNHCAEALCHIQQANVTTMQVALTACASWGGMTIIHWVLLRPRCGHNTTKRQRKHEETTDPSTHERHLNSTEKKAGLGSDCPESTTR